MAGRTFSHFPFDSFLQAMGECGRQPTLKHTKGFQMRTIATCLAGLAWITFTTNVFAQGLINWNNTSGTLISLNGWSTMPYRMSPETTYHFGLFIAPLGTAPPANGLTGIDDPDWQFVAAYTMNSTAAAGAGRMQNPGLATVIGYGAGTSVSFIVRGWQSWSGGADWPAAKQGLQNIGQSAVGTALLGGGPFPIPAAFGSGAGQIGGFSFGCLSCHPPWFQTSPSSKSVFVGGDVTLNASATSYDLSPTRYQWRKQSSPITGATNASLTLTNVTLSDAGDYDVIASNSFGNTPSSVATVTVLIPAVSATLNAPVYLANNQFQFTVTGSAGSNYVVQVATNLAAPTVWVSLLTNTSPFTFVDSNTQNYSQRFYRALAW